jgi:hypothetical protein
VIDTVSRGGDTDTNGAIAGALLGAVHGALARPMQWRDRVLSCRPIEGLDGVDQPRPAVYWPTDVLELAEALVGGRRADMSVAGGGTLGHPFFGARGVESADKRTGGRANVKESGIRESLETDHSAHRLALTMLFGGCEADARGDLLSRRCISFHFRP